MYSHDADTCSEGAPLVAALPRLVDFSQSATQSTRVKTALPRYMANRVSNMILRIALPKCVRRNLA